MRGLKREVREGLGAVEGGGERGKGEERVMELEEQVLSGNSCC